METPVFIARIFGIFYLVAAAGLLLNRQFYKKFMEDYTKNTALVFFSGMFALIVGACIVLYHNVWTANWTVIITLLGWIALFKGAWIIIFPNSTSRLMQYYQVNENLLIIHGIAAFIFGAVMAYFGFFA
jgi:hypothetical protein